MRHELFFRLGLEYYIAGRFSHSCTFHPITAVLFHHAIERFIKAKLASSNYTNKVLREKFSHNLKKSWKECKKLCANSSLNEYDDVIRKLDKWEPLRYPYEEGHVSIISVRKGTESKINWKHAPKTMKRVKEFYLNLEEIDELVKKFCTVILPTNLRFYSGIVFLRDEAKEFYRRENYHQLDIE